MVRLTWPLKGELFQKYFDIIEAQIALLFTIKHLLVKAFIVIIGFILPFLILIRKSIN